MRDMEGDTTFVAGLGLVVEQLILKIVMKVPIRNVSLDNTHVKSLADLVSCITQKDEQLLLTRRWFRNWLTCNLRFHVMRSRYSQATV